MKVKLGSVEINANLSEMSLESYVKIASLTSLQNSTIEEWAKALISMGGIKNEVNEMDIEEELKPAIIDLIKKLSEQKSDLNPIFTHIIEGRTYVCGLTDKGSVKITKSHNKLLAKYSKNKDFTIYALAIVLHDISVNDAANYAPAAIEKRVEMLKKQPCINYLGLIIAIMDKINAILEAKKEEIDEKLNNDVPNELQRV